MVFQLVGEEAQPDESFYSAVRHQLRRTIKAGPGKVGIVQVRLCCEQMSDDAPRFLGALLARGNPADVNFPAAVSGERFRVVASGSVEELVATFETVATCLELAARHVQPCAGACVCLTIADDDATAEAFLRRADQEFEAAIAHLRRVRRLARAPSRSADPPPVRAGALDVPATEAVTRPGRTP